MTEKKITPDMTFSEASAIWFRMVSFQFGASAAGIAGTTITRRITAIGPRTTKDLRRRLSTLCQYFGDTRLQDITPEQVRRYQELRVSGAFHNLPCGARFVNRDTSLLKRILTKCKMWSLELQDDYLPLHDSGFTEVGHALTPDEQRAWLDAAKRVSPFIYYYSILAIGTTASTNELRALQIKDFNFQDMIVKINTGKNKYRVRTIPLLPIEELPFLPESVETAARWLIERAQSMGCSQPEHYLFPSQVFRSRFNPNAPTPAISKKQWAKVEQASGIKIRRYDLRHTGITRFAESGMSVQMLMALAGHVTQKMQQHYTHISTAAQRRAMSAKRAETPAPAATAQAGMTSEMLEMLKAAHLVKESGVDVQTAIAIVRGYSVGVGA